MMRYLPKTMLFAKNNQSIGGKRRKDKCKGFVIPKQRAQSGSTGGEIWVSRTQSLQREEWRDEANELFLL